MTPRALRAEWPLLLVMSVLFLGPLIAPLFQATGVWGLADSGALARDLLSRYVCPTPAKSYMLLGYPMAVCARCWGGTVGLWAAWLLLRSSRGIAPYLGLHPLLRVLVAALAFLLWPAEIVGWPDAPLWALLINGALAGLLGGLALLSLWRDAARGRQRAAADNRRLYAFRQANIPNRTVHATPEEVVEESWKFTTNDDETSIRVRR